MHCSKHFADVLAWLKSMKIIARQQILSAHQWIGVNASASRLPMYDYSLRPQAHSTSWYPSVVVYSFPSYYLVISLRDLDDLSITHYYYGLRGFYTIIYISLFLSLSLSVKLSHGSIISLCLAWTLGLASTHCGWPVSLNYRPSIAWFTSHWALLFLQQANDHYPQLQNLAQRFQTSFLQNSAEFMSVSRVIILCCFTSQHGTYEYNIW